MLATVLMNRNDLIGSVCLGGYLAVFGGPVLAADESGQPPGGSEFSDFLDGQFELGTGLKLIHSVGLVPLTLEDAARLPRTQYDTPFAKPVQASDAPILYEFRSPFSEIRSVSLLTLFRTDRSRLFLGVSDDGQPGIHLDIAPGRYLSNKTHYEFMSLPDWGDDEEQESAAE